MRLGWAGAVPVRRQRWHGWGCPLPGNGLAIAAGVAVMNDPVGLQRWQRRVQQWVQQEGSWFRAQLDAIPGFKAYPSAANYLLIQGEESLLELRDQLARQGVLLRDCRSFQGLGEHWLRIGLQDRRGNQRILRALRRIQLNSSSSRVTSFCSASSTPSSRMASPISGSGSALSSPS